MKFFALAALLGLASTIKLARHDLVNGSVQHQLGENHEL